MWCWLCCESCSMLGLCSLGYIQCLYVCSLSFAVLQMCVCGTWTHTLCAYIKLTFHLHHTRQQLFCLHCTLVSFCRKSYLPSIIRTVLALLVWTDSLHQGMDQSAQWHKLCLDSTVLRTYIKSANTQTLPSPRY